MALTEVDIFPKRHTLLFGALFRLLSTCPGPPARAYSTPGILFQTVCVAARVPHSDPLESDLDPYNINQ